MRKVASTIPQVCIFDGAPQEVRNVRHFVGKFVEGFAAADEVILLSSEIATNAILHSASGADGKFSVSVLVENGWVRVEVHDLGSVMTPGIRQACQPSESGRGLYLVNMIADRWGFQGGPRGRVVWFEMDRN